MKEISFLLAFSAGFLSFLSPCVLPIIPAYLSFLTGSSIQELKEGKDKLQTLYKAFGFVLGFSIVFILMGISFTALGKLFIVHRDLFRKSGGIIIILFGLHTMGVLKFKLLYREKRMITLDKVKGPFSSIIIGIAFASGWTPCIGPILSSILIYAANADSKGKGIMLLILYSLGMAVPFILASITISSFSGYIKKISKYFPAISIISGALMIIIGILIFLNKLIILYQYTNFFNF